MRALAGRKDVPAPDLLNLLCGQFCSAVTLTIDLSATIDLVGHVLLVISEV